MVLAFACTFPSMSYASRDKFKPPATQSGMPEITFSNTSMSDIKKYLLSHLADSNFFLAKQDENLLTFESAQKPMTFGQLMSQSLWETQLTQAMSNKKYLLRISCQITPTTQNDWRVIIRSYSVVSPGTPAERTNEISRQDKSQETYYKLLENMKAELEMSPATNIDKKAENDTPE